MYRTAVITDEISQDLEAAARMAASFGLQALEIRSVWGRNPFDMDLEDKKRIKRIADAYGLKICAIAAPLFKCDLLDEAAFKDHVTGAARCMEAAQIWDAKLIRGFTFWNREKGEEDFEAIADRYQPILRMAQENGVTIALESEPSVTTSNINLLARFLEQVDHPCLGALYDPGNEIADPNAPAPYPTGYERLKSYIRHIHIKDMRHTKEGGLVPAMLGEGDVDFQGLFQRLKVDGYSGYVSVETHYRIRNAQLDDALLVRPQGSAFSEGGQEATHAYFSVLRDTYHWMEALS